LHALFVGPCAPACDEEGQEEGPGSKLLRARVVPVWIWGAGKGASTLLVRWGTSEGAAARWISR
jgi:hypothetical protein